MRIISRKGVQEIVVDANSNKELLELISKMDGVSIRLKRGKAHIIEQKKEKKPYGIIIKRSSKKHKRIRLNTSNVKMNACGGSRSMQSSAIIAKV